MIDFSHKSKAGSSFTSTKQANEFDAAASEKLRAEAAKEARIKEEQARGRQQILDLEKELEHNKQEISSKNIEIRRLSQEIFHADSEIRALDQGTKVFDAKEDEAKTKIGASRMKLQEKQKLAVSSRLEIEEKKREEKKLDAQVAELQRKLGETRRAIQEAEQKIKEADLETRHIEGAMGRTVSEEQHNSSTRDLELKKIDNKKKAIFALEQKRKNQGEEVSRLTIENKRIETAIQALKSRIKPF